MSGKVALAVSVLFYDSAESERLPAARACEIVRVLLERGYSVRRADSLAGGCGAAAGGGRFRSTAGSLAAGPGDRRLVRRLRRCFAGRGCRPGRPGRVVRQPGRARLEAVVPGDRLQPLYELHAVPELLPVRRLRRYLRGEDTVVNPSNCKTDCPACARVCPEVAIMFPKYRRADQRRGSECRRRSPRSAENRMSRALLGGDIYSMLRDRSQRAKSRFSKERDDDRALEERRRCLARSSRRSRIGYPARSVVSICLRPTRFAKRPRPPSEKRKRPWHSSRKMPARTESGKPSQAIRP